MINSFPIRVGLMDDDFCALKWNAQLLTRDLRTTVRFECETPSELMQTLSLTQIDLLLLDGEFDHPDYCLASLLQAIHRLPNPPVTLCLFQYASLPALLETVTSGARGYLLKNEIRMAIVSAVTLAMRVPFLITPGVGSLLQQQSGRKLDQVRRINAWSPHPALTPQLRQVFTLRVLYGMSAPLTAQEIHLSTGTVEKYMQYAYEKLGRQWGDETYLMGLNLGNLTPEVEAFHRFTLPPIKRNS